MKKRILTGDRPTGKLHLGHYVGSLKNRVRLQDEYECFFIIADLHTLTTRPEKTGELSENIRQLVLDYLSVGIDPQKSTIYVQSQIPEVAEMAVIFSNLVTVPRVQRVPTLKDVMRDANIKTPSLGLLAYPVLQSADILMVRANLVPVGRDQAAHIEVTREIAKEFNRLYPSHSRAKRSEAIESRSYRSDASLQDDTEGVFPVPEALIPNDIGTLPGTDGKAKMSKSAGNVINLSDDSATVRKQVMGMYTDPRRIHGDELGTVEGNPVFVYLDAFVEEIKNQKSKIKILEEYKEKYKAGTVKDVEVKEFLVLVLNEFLEPIRRRREEFEKQPELFDKILKEGTEKAR
ncbi:tryptophan--tRNA ligase, partial [Candidatus Curtissbacteria bacterium]|nr:tryptophan--tRNA ligase [Candidatus Curtissbacteria bacterium]